jgi:hypothetical protein
VAFGTISCSSSRSFGATSTFNEVTPVILPPGRLRLATTPSFIRDGAAFIRLGCPRASASAPRSASRSAKFARVLRGRARLAFRGASAAAGI